MQQDNGTHPEGPGEFSQDPAGLNGSYFMKRREEKYDMPIGAAAFVRNEVEQHLPLFEFRKGNRHTYITTVYFDNEKLDFYQKAKAYYDDNLKIRVKEYYYQGPAGASSPWFVFDYCFLEIKQRIQGLVVKRRFEMPKVLLGRLLRGEDIWDDLVASRSGMEFHGVIDVYREFRWFLQRYQVNAKSIINYRRSVYQEDEHELRITFDDEIAVFAPPPQLYEKTQSLARSFLGEPDRVFSHVIMEIKCQNGYPEWLSRLLRTHAPKRFSKFTSSLNVLTQELPQPVTKASLPYSPPPTPPGGSFTHLEESQASGDTTQVADIKL